MSPDVRLQIDRHTVEVPAGTTVLRAAEAAGVAVPALCSHPELTPFGGCRLCAVEIDGMKPYPLACSTAVTEGMRVLTDTAGAARGTPSDPRAPPLAAPLELPRVRRAGRLPPHAADHPQVRGRDRLPELPARRRLRAAARGGAGRRRRRRSPGRLPGARTRARRAVLRPRLQPLHPVRPLRAHVRGGARRRRARLHRPRAANADRPRLRQVARGGRLRVLRGLRVGLPHRRARRQGVEVGRRARRRRRLDLSSLPPRLSGRAGARRGPALLGTRRPRPGAQRRTAVPARPVLPAGDDAASVEGAPAQTAQGSHTTASSAGTRRSPR